MNFKTGASLSTAAAIAKQDNSNNNMWNKWMRTPFYLACALILTVDVFLFLAYLFAVAKLNLNPFFVGFSLIPVLRYLIMPIAGTLGTKALRDCVNYRMNSWASTRFKTDDEFTEWLVATHPLEINKTLGEP